MKMLKLEESGHLGQGPPVVELGSELMTSSPGALGLNCFVILILF